MVADPRNVVVLGSTGSIGRNTLAVMENAANLRPFALSAHAQLDLAVEQCQRFRPRYLIATCRETADQLDRSALPSETELLIGEQAVEATVSRAEVDIVVSAIVGSAGLRGSWAAVEAGKQVALANKETLVVAGSLIMELAKKNGATLIPVDSEHNAIFQALQAGRRADLEKIILTASGGPFLRLETADLAHVTLEQALKHPTYDMGPKITIDSATMLNKALEIVEARWLFDVAPNTIQVVIHPQSVVHSMVEFVDGSIIAQLSPPDMRLPIQYALTYPDRVPGVARRMHWDQLLELTFEPPDLDRFPAIRLGNEVAARGGTAGAVLNAAKEKAVQLFIDGELGFSEIVEACEKALNYHTFDPRPTLDQLLLADAWARKEVDRWAMAS